MTTEGIFARPAVKIDKNGRRMSPNSLANLKPPYKKGENGHGRVYPLKERLRHGLDKPLVKPPDDAPAGDLIVYSTLKGAVDLVAVAFKETWERTEGKVADPTPAGYQDNRTINIIVSSEKAQELTENIAHRLMEPK